MFSAIPSPHVEWSKDNMRYMLCFLPVVGIVVGAVLVLWEAICSALGFEEIISSVGLTLIPVLITGGIHLDGYCDTADALASHALPEKKAHILKDSNAGAFAVIYTGVFFLAFFAFGTELEVCAKTGLLIGIMQVMSRALSVFASTVFPKAGTNGLLAFFTDSASRKTAIVSLIWMILCACGLIVISPIGGAFAVLAAILCIAYIGLVAKKQFLGMNGDLAGYINTLSGLIMLIFFIFAERIFSL